MHVYQGLVWLRYTGDPWSFRFLDLFDVAISNSVSVPSLPRRRAGQEDDGRPSGTWSSGPLVLWSSGPQVLRLRRTCLCITRLIYPGIPRLVTLSSP